MRDRELERLFLTFREHGDVDALTRVFDATAPKLMTVARHLARDEATAEDFVQATFLTALQHARRFDAERDLEGWLVGILTNTALDYRRRMARAIDPTRIELPVVPDPALEAEHADLVELFERALLRVPEAYRAVLHRHIARGETPDEIARSMQRSSGTVRTQLHRGMKFLRRMLPAGLAVGGAAVVTAPRGFGAPRGLVAVKSVVLADAARFAPAAAAGSVGVVTGVLLMKKTIGIVVVALLVILLGLRFAGYRSARGDELDARASNTELQREPAPNLPPAIGDAVVAPELARTSLNSDDPFGALDVLVLWHDETPVVGAWIGAQSDDQLAPRKSPQIEGTTDAEGRFHAAHIHAGPVLVGLAFTGEPMLIDVKRGETAALVFHIPRGRDVRGRVVDRRHEPVADAVIYIGNVERGRGLMLMTRSASDGTFFLRSVAPKFALIAVAGDHAPSAPEIVGNAPDIERSAPREMELVVENDGARLHVTLMRSDGSRAVGEWLEAVTPSLRRFETRSALWARTDAQGEAMFDGLPAGTIEVLLSPDDAPCTRRSVVLEPGKLVDLVVELQAGAFVSGAITHLDGSSWDERARVSVDLASGGESGYDSTVGSTCFRCARADASGRYRLGPLPPGKLSLLFDVYDASNKQRLVREARVVETVDGQEVTMDVAVDAPHLIRGRVVDEQGAPVAGWKVTAAAIDSIGSPRAVETDAKGRFVLGPCVENAHRVWANPPPGDALRGAQLDSVMSDGPDIEIRVAAVSAPTSRAAFVTGILLEARGALATDCGVSLLRAGANASTGASLASDGSFRAGPLEAGTYTLSLSRVGDEFHELVANLDVADGATVDVGQLSLPACGTFVLYVERPDGVKVDGFDAELVDARGKHHRVEHTLDGAFRSLRIPVGAYTLHAQLSNAFVPDMPVEIRTDERTQLELTGESATFTTIEFRLPADAAATEPLHATIRRGGEVVATYGPFRSTSDERIRRLPLALPVGSYTWSATLGQGWIGEGPLEIVEGRQSTALELHAR